MSVPAPKIPSEPASPPASKPASAPGSPRRWNALALAGLALAMAFTYRAIFLGRVVAGRDVFRLFIPSSAYLFECLKAHEWPLWLPYVRLGQPFAGSPQSQAFYPPQILAVLLTSPVYTPTVLQFFHVTVAAVGTFLALRALSLGRRASAFGASVFALSPLFAQMSYLPNLSGASAWSGFVLLGALAVRRSPSLKAAARLAWPLALSSLCGSPEMTLWQGLLAAAVCLSAPRRLASGAHAALAAFWAFALAAITLIPASEFAAHSTREFARDHLTWSVPFGQLVSTFLPLADMPRSDYWGRDQFLLISFFIGSTTLFLLVLGLGGKRARPFWAVGLFLALLSLGEYFAPAAFLLRRPPLALFRYPAKYVVGAAFCAAVLSAFGLERLEALARRRPASTRVLMRSLLGIAIGLIVALGIAQRPVFRSGLQFGLAWATGALALLAIAFCAVRGPRRARWVARAAFALLLCEFALNLGLSRPAGWVQAKPLETPSTLATLLPRPVPGRISTVLPFDPETDAETTDEGRGSAGITRPNTYVEGGRAGLVPMQAIVEQLPGLEGYGPPEPAHTEDEINGANRAVYDFLGVRYYVREKAPFPDARKLGEVPGISALFEVDTALPRAFVVYRAKQASDAAAERALVDPKLPLRDTVLLPHEPAPLPATDCAPTPAALVEGRERANADFTACAEGYLVVTDAYYPGWEATLDGRPVAIERADLTVRAIRVSQGPHHLEMIYRPKSFRLGLALTLLGLLALGAAWRFP